MKRINWNITYLLLPILLFMLLLSGCGSIKDNSIVTINDKKLYMEDFLYEIYLVEKEGNQLETYYQEKFGSSYWDFDYNGTTAREAAKSSVMSSVIMYEILSDQAEKNGLDLTSDELAADEKTVKDILQASPKVTADNIGLTYDILKRAVDQRFLGDKYRNELINSFKIDKDAISKGINPADYQEYKTECLFVPTFSVKDKQIVPYGEEESATALSAITNALEKLSQGETMDNIQGNIPELIYDTRDFVRGDILVEEEYQTAAVNLKKDEISQIIETKYGYYVIHMLDNNSTARYEQAVSEAIKEEEDKQFTQEYNRIKAQYDININFDNWDLVRIGQASANTSSTN